MKQICTKQIELRWQIIVALLLILLMMIQVNPSVSNRAYAELALERDSSLVNNILSQNSISTRSVQARKFSGSESADSGGKST